MMRPCFIHIPKVAGTAMKEFLRQQYGPNNVYVENSWDKSLREIGMGEIDHARFDAFAGHTPFEYYQNVPDTFCFAFVRDPLERRLSEYAYIRRTPSHEVYQIVKDQSFEDFLCSPDRQSNEQCRYLMENHGSRRAQSVEETMYTFGHRLLVAPSQYISQVFVFLALRFHWQRRVLPFVNVSMPREKPDVSPAARQIVREIDGEDQKLYDGLLKRPLDYYGC